MSDKFDLSDFDTPPDEADHRVFLDAIRKAAAEGVRSASAPLVATASEIERQTKAMRAAERSVQTANTSLTAAKSALLWDHVQQLFIIVIAVGIVLAGAGAGAYWLKAPKVEEKLFGCTSWDARKQACRNDWIPLRSKAEGE